MSDQNTRFLAALRKLEQQPAGYRAAHMHVSELPPGKKTRDNVSRAIQVLNDLKNKHKEGHIFLLKNADIVFLTRAINKVFLAQACEEVERSFVGTAGVGFTNRYGGEREFFTILELSHDFAKLMDFAEEASGIAFAKPGGGGPDAKVVDIDLLSTLKGELKRNDITAMLFNQPVYNIGNPQRISVLFHEIYVSIQALQDKYCPGVSLTSRKWLFNDLTEDLDAAVLRSLLKNEDRSSRRRFSINLNLASLESDAFAAFDQDMPPERRACVILEIAKTDLFDNPRLFKRQAARYRERGYRFCIDGLSPHALLHMDLTDLDIDFAKLFWSGEMEELTTAEFERLRGKMLDAPEVQFILARCDSADSVRFARKAGVFVAQGRLLDQMIKKQVPI